MRKEKKIGDYCEVGDGAHASIPRVEIGVPYLTSKNFGNSGIKLDKIDYISEDDFKKYFRKNSNALTKPQKNDLIFSIIGSMGGAHLYTDNDLFGLSSSVAIIRPDSNFLDSHYLLYYLKSEYLQKWIESIKSGSAQGFLSLEMIRNLPLILPNLSTQTKIASILSTYDDLMKNNNQRIQLLEDMAEEIFKEWFVRLRFPDNEKFKTSEFKKIKLRECLLHYIGGGWGEEFSKGNNTIPAYVIRGTDFPNFNKGTLNFDVLRYHTESNLSSRICEPNDIIFEVSGGTESQSLGRTCFISKAALKRFDEPVICASFCKLLRVNNKKVSPFYINELLNRMHKTGELKVFQVQSTGISNYQFEDFIEATKVLVPPKEVQDSFDKIVSQMYDEIQLLGAKNQVLQETRDLLLPRLISGKLSVAHLIEKDRFKSANEFSRSIAAEPEIEYKKS